MEKINNNNYEAYFLDFAEGNLSANEIEQLERFLEKNPNLRSELDNFEIVEVPKATDNAEAWNNLKKPYAKELQENVELRDSFFFRAVENDLTSFELKMLEELVAVPAFANEYNLWKRVVLIADESQMQKDSLYQFGLDQLITDFNYEYFLIASCEGLLSAQQNAELKKFAITRPYGVRELAIANNLKLKPAKGIFYPDKESLYQNKKKGIVIWLYRAAAIAAVLFVGIFIWSQIGNPPIEKAPISEVEQVKSLNTIIPVDSNKVKKEARQDTLPETEVIREQLLQDWEIREPDPVNLAGKQPNGDKSKALKSESRNELYLQKKHSIEPIEIDKLAENRNNLDLVKDSITVVPIPQTLKSETLAEAKTTSKFKTVPELAEDLIAQKLNIPDSEKDEMAMIVAKRITSRASELLDAEYTKEETGMEGDESLTYTLRIGSFKLMRSKCK